MAGCRFNRDDFVDFVIETLPAILSLAGDNKLRLAGGGLAMPGEAGGRRGTRWNASLPEL